MAIRQHRFAERGSIVYCSSLFLLDSQVRPINDNESNFENLQKTLQLIILRFLCAGHIK
ncbi:hypothetical protein C2G38_859828 [Gigaspora rosea]|uniref:Uncharacterized protein n=1 Tax=Gigaspora rosea TaxID=44941 RepID=A0A397TX49_9GLOM|nr:hypothetical protein C2G38_859828 [Gigaspora rosea]